jgi:xanthine dehydrogenase iron-sulfur cluster and FAD-binding subunit A
VWQQYLRPTTLPDAARLTATHRDDARIVAGGTDLVVELARGVRPTATVIDLTAVAGMRYVRAADGWIELGALTTHNDVLASRLCRGLAAPLAQACREVGAPQIRARGTVVGNLVTASPANDTIAPLLALDAELIVVAAADGALAERVVPLTGFYPGFRRTALRPGEIVRAVRFAAATGPRRGAFVKVGLRRAQAIAVVNLAAVLRLEGGQVAEAALALGSVAPTVMRAPAAEQYLIGKQLTAAVCARAGEIAAAEIRPIDDVRASADYRRTVVATTLPPALLGLAGEPSADPGESPVLLQAPTSAPRRRRRRFDGSVRVEVNGRAQALTGAAGKTLLRALREDVGLTGTKEGCAEGECGACTVWLDGGAVMACLTPAAQADGGRVTTVEGLARDGALHPLQAAFVAAGAVQCGYCTPGFLMAGAMLLEERPAPDEAAVREALAGNLCRCTGYRKIVDAVMGAR